MKGKIKNIVKGSFVFPEPVHKDEFFGQLDDRSVIQKKSRSNLAVFVRFTAVTAAAAFCIAAWRSMDFAPVLHRNESMSAGTETNETQRVTDTTAGSVNRSESVTITIPTDPPKATETAPEVSENVSAEFDNSDFSVISPTAPISTDVPVSPDPPVISDERSIYMKKFTAFTSAVVILAANSSLNVFAEYQPPEIGSDLQAVIDHITETNPDLDFNCDGIFDARDLYIFNRYTSARLTLTDDAMARCAENGDVNKDGIIDYEDWRGLDKYAASIGDAAQTVLDFNGDGNYFIFDNHTLLEYVCVTTLCSNEGIVKIHANGDVNCDGTVDTADARSLIDYYVLHYPVAPEELRESHYETEGIPDSDWESNFIYFLRCAISDYDMGYRNITETVQNDAMSLDFNSDGKTNILDAYDYFFYCSVKDTNADYDEYVLTSTPLLSRVTWENCAYFDSIRPDGYGSVDAGINTDEYAVMKYFLYNTEITEEMLNPKMYSAHRMEGSGSFALDLKHMAEEEGIIAADGTTINDQLFWMYYDKCETAFNSGERALPDVDLNGVIDYEDYFTASIFFHDHLTGTSCEDSILPADVWNHFNQNCDFNENGISGDVYDTTIVSIYVIKHAAEEPANFDAAYQAYIDVLKSAKGSKDDTEVTEEELLSLMTAYDRNYDLLCGTDMERSGDANNDRTISIVDAVATAKSYTVPEDYQLTAKGRFNADVCNTGDGVTTEDATAILNQLVGNPV